MNSYNIHIYHKIDMMKLTERLLIWDRYKHLYQHTDKYSVYEHTCM